MTCLTAAAVAAVWAGAALADVRFEDHSSALGDHQYLGGWEHFVGGGVAVMDCDANGLPDIFAAGGTAPAALWINTGEFTFEHHALTSLTGVTGAYPLDIDGDTDADLFVLRAGRNKLLLNDGQCGFVDATDAAGLPDDTRWSTAFSAWWDHNEERPSLAIGNYVDREDPDGPFGTCDDNQLLRPAETGWHETLLSPGYCALSMLAAFDARGQLALRLSNDRHYYLQGGHEQMWDIATGQFLGPEDGWPLVSLWGMGIASRDLTGDGRDEVMLTSMGDQLLQLANDDGAYVNAPYAIGTYAQRPHTGDDGRPSTGWHAEFADVNNDGRSDLFIAKGNVDQMPGMAMDDPNNLLLQQSDGRFVEAALSAGIADTARSRGAALADFDADGRLDLVVVNRRAAVRLYRNVSVRSSHWLGLDLRQPGGNSHAIGARVVVTAGGATQHVQRSIGGGHAGGQLLPLHIGLGPDTSADVRIIWPDGTESRHALDAGLTHRITKP